jgi:hypothetical protein
MIGIYHGQKLAGVLVSPEPDAGRWEQLRKQLSTGEQNVYLYLRHEVLRAAAMDMTLARQRLGVSKAQVARDIDALIVKGFVTSDRDDYGDESDFTLVVNDLEDVDAKVIVAPPNDRSDLLAYFEERYNRRALPVRQVYRALDGKLAAIILRRCGESLETAKGLVDFFFDQPSERVREYSFKALFNSIDRMMEDFAYTRMMDAEYIRWKKEVKARDEVEAAFAAERGETLEESRARRKAEAEASPTPWESFGRQLGDPRNKRQPRPIVNQESA